MFFPSKNFGPPFLLRVLILLTLFCTNFGFSQEPNIQKVTSVNGTIQNITKEVGFLIDNTSKLTFSEIKDSKHFQIYGNQATGFKPSYTKTYWFRFKLSSTSKSPLLLTLNSPQLDHADLYKIEKGKVKLVRDGDMVPWSKKEYQYRYPVFPINPQNHGLYYLKVKTPGTTAFKIRVMDKYHFLKNHHQEIIWDIALSASLLILLFYNFCLNI